MTLRRTQLPITRPCPLPGDIGDGLCTHCNETVHDLSAMTETAARELTRAKPNACVVYRLRRDDTIAFRDAPRPARWATVAVLAVALSGCASIYEATHGHAPPSASDVELGCPVRAPAAPPLAADPTPGHTVDVNFEIDPEATFVRGGLGIIRDDRGLLDRRAERLSYTPTKQLVAGARRRRRARRAD